MVSSLHFIIRKFLSTIKKKNHYEIINKEIKIKNVHKLIQESKKRQKTEEEDRKQKERAHKLAEYEKLRNPAKPNFVIKKKSGDEKDDDEEAEVGLGWN